MFAPPTSIPINSLSMGSWPMSAIEGPPSTSASWSRSGQVGEASRGFPERDLALERERAVGIVRPSDRVLLFRDRVPNDEYVQSPPHQAPFTIVIGVLAFASSEARTAGDA
ncbi:MAG: hypothetical protein E6G04_09310 [Actinobacteria bacterium]|nr:MAG: hypothetical protein E6G04_09310 [Actinomycetota bacterium]